MTFAPKAYIRKPRTPLSIPAVRPEPRAIIKTAGEGAEPVLKSEYIRSKPYREAVAKLACRNCNVPHQSQAAHPNSDSSGAAGGKKASDIFCFPLCHVGSNDCHRAFDRYELCSKADMPLVELQWLASTQAELISKSQELGAEAARLRALLVKLGVCR